MQTPPKQNGFGFTRFHLPRVNRKPCCGSALYETTPQTYQTTTVQPTKTTADRHLSETQLPAILHKRYELKALDEKQARSAIVRPALLPAEDGDFSTPSFTFTDGALNDIVPNLRMKKVAGSGLSTSGRCQNLEKQVKKAFTRRQPIPGYPQLFLDTRTNSELNEAEKTPPGVEDGLCM